MARLSRCSATGQESPGNILPTDKEIKGRGGKKKRGRVRMEMGGGGGGVGSEEREEGIGEGWRQVERSE